MPGLGESDVFLDSNQLRDMREIPNLVESSDAVILLLTQKVFSRPFCLLELFTAAKANIPIILCRIGDTHCLSLDDLEDMFGDPDKLAHYLRENYPDSSNALEQQSTASCMDARGCITIGEEIIPAREVSEVLKKAICDAAGWRGRVLSFTPHESVKLRNVQACVVAKSVAAHTLANRVVQENAAIWIQNSSKTDLIGLPRNYCICIVNAKNTPEPAQEAKRMKQWLCEYTDLDEEQVLLQLQPAEENRQPDKASSLVVAGEVALGGVHVEPGRKLRRRLESFGRTLSTDFQPTQSSKRVLAVLVLQTSDMLKEPGCVSQLYAALDYNIPLIPIVLSGPAFAFVYDYSAAKTLMADLTVLGERVVDTLESRCRGASVADVSALLTQRIPTQISQPLLMEGGGVSSASRAEYSMQMLIIASSIKGYCKEVDPEACGGSPFMLSDLKHDPKVDQHASFLKSYHATPADGSLSQDFGAHQASRTNVVDVDVEMGVSSQLQEARAGSVDYSVATEPVDEPQEETGLLSASDRAVNREPTDPMVLVLQAGGDAVAELIGSVFDAAIEVLGQQKRSTPRKERRPVTDLIARSETLAHAMDDAWCTVISRSNDLEQLVRLLANVRSSCDESSGVTASSGLVQLLDWLDRCKHPERTGRSAPPPRAKP